MQSLYEHIVQIFAQAAFGILADQKLSFIDPSNPYISLPYLIIQALNQNLQPQKLRSMPPYIVRSLVSVVVSIFALSWPDNSPQGPSLVNTPITNMQRTLPVNSQRLSGNEADIASSSNESSAENIDLNSTYKNTTGPSSTIMTDNGLLTPGSFKQSSEVGTIRLAKTYVECLWNEGSKLLSSSKRL